MALIGIDVGSGSARAGVFDDSGVLLGTASHPIALHRDGLRVEQSSDDIWSAICTCVRAAMGQSGVAAEDIAGIGIDATCSLVVLGPGGAPLPVGDSPARNIMVWMDHRALDQAERINAMGHRVLDYVGGRISPEMETPKMLWLKENAPEIYAGAWQFMDLTDFLTWRATGDLARSICTVTCKWTYLGHDGGWDADYFRRIGLGDLAEDGFARIGSRVVDAGAPLGQGLTAQAAADLGLRPGTPVGAGLIDAHAGGVGTVGAKGAGGAQANLAYVFGTSSCTMTSTAEPVFVPGVWGPYFSAMVPGLWLNEGGQSAAGAAIDQLIDFHPAAADARVAADADELSLPAWLAKRGEQMAAKETIAALVRGLHVVPEVLGNRAPHADPHSRAVIAGLGMERDEAHLVRLYLACLCGIGYGLRQIVLAQKQAGASVSRIVLSGGAGRSPLVRQLLADAAGLPLAVPETPEPVLLGSAILGAVAGGVHPNIPSGMEAMSRLSSVIEPDPAARAVHEERYAIFTALQSTARLAPRC
ncbi:FGGY-family carbohydrate kinase [Paracoccus sp. TK19116]|uniref:FGGY-family carbohydrate kinase n=1 Tax=Paracoccus albicereus TaxID=2922394 RepID=A0ABT1MS46_9RHOB|nr:FGGY-family carbohydrate kinase [Paracoccus albicereus]MCQ0971129.1 FGGY-family carbohydrate kinase [Paracoccus albicereus]